MVRESAADRAVAAVGFGCIGLLAVAILALSGRRVTGVGASDRVIDMDQPLREAAQSGNLTAQTEMPRASACCIAVPTSFQQGYRADLSFFFAVGGQTAVTVCRLRSDSTDSLYFARVFVNELLLTVDMVAVITDSDIALRLVDCREFREVKIDLLVGNRVLDMNGILRGIVRGVNE